MTSPTENFSYGGGTMPRLNWVFEELDIHHEEHKVPSKVLKSIEEKGKEGCC